MNSPFIMAVVLIKLYYPKINTILIRKYNYIEGYSYEK